jgi:uncharacterized protein
MRRLYHRDEEISFMAGENGAGDQGTREQGTRNPGNFAANRERASKAGHIGGRNSSGNFAHNRERAAEAGRKGGLASHARNKVQSQPSEQQPNGD